ncbi:hypothetical protein B0T10DRAFT_552660 [Thelonectria olida]|uniref:Uncharacterized protein n=1 Tax=Thelonectria olida TaxID=1576542 RepID=A0A9P9AJZ2_9HYPO|nr:hypothetical protein B0T10DRAFT_552660 [Thelonectria olida]
MGLCAKHCVSTVRPFPLVLMSCSTQGQWTIRPIKGVYFRALIPKSSLIRALACLALARVGMTATDLDLHVNKLRDAAKHELVSRLTGQAFVAFWLQPRIAFSIPKDHLPLRVWELSHIGAPPAENQKEFGLKRKGDQKSSRVLSTRGLWRLPSSPVLGEAGLKLINALDPPSTSSFIFLPDQILDGPQGNQEALSLFRCHTNSAKFMDRNSHFASSAPTTTHPTKATSSAMAANPNSIKASPSISSAPTPPTHEKKKCSSTCAIDDSDDEDYEESLEDFKKSIESSWSSCRTRYLNTANSSNNSSVARRSNLTLMFEREEQAEKARAQKRKELEEQGILTGPVSTEHKREHTPPLEATNAHNNNDNSNLSTADTSGLQVTPQQRIPPMNRDFHFLKDVYNLDKRKPSEEDRQFWHRQLNIPNAW